MHALDALTGAVVYGPNRVAPDAYSSSPILADGKIYITGEKTGTTSEFRAGPKFELLAENNLGDGCEPYCLSTVAVSEGQIFLRTSAHLWAIGNRKK